jgi:hypothetical protein
MNFAMPLKFFLEKNYVFHVYILSLVKYTSGQMFFFILRTSGSRSDRICFRKLSTLNLSPVCLCFTRMCPHVGVVGPWPRLLPLHICPWCHVVKVLSWLHPLLSQVTPHELLCCGLTQLMCILAMQCT